MSVIETVRYQLKDGATKEDQVFKAIGQTLDGDDLPKLEGRKIAVTDSGEFLDFVEWVSMEDAKAASANFDPAKYPELLGLVKVLDETSMVMSHYTVMASTK